MQKMCSAEREECQAFQQKKQVMAKDGNMDCLVLGGPAAGAGGVIVHDLHQRHGPHRARPRQHIQALACRLCLVEIEHNLDFLSI